MESVLKKIFSGKIDDEVHNDFIKFGRGTFSNKYLVDAKKQKDRWAVKTSADFANFFVRKCLEKASGEVDIKGVIVANSKIEEDAGFPIEKVKQFMGIKQAVVNTKVSPKKLIELMDKYPKAFFALSFSTKDCELKIKPKAPKSAKPAASGEKEPKPEFCSLKTSDKSFIEDLFFDYPNFNQISAKHTLEIKEIILPKGESDPVRIRELAKRKGKLIRELNVDGRANKSEKEFLA